MKKSIKLLALFASFIVILAACGQSNTAIDPATEEDGIEHDQNDQVIANAEEKNDQDTSGSEQEEEIVTVENSHPVNLYFSDIELNHIYSVETIVEGQDEEVFINTLNAWIAGPDHENLTSLIPENVTVQSIEDKDGVAHISFSKEILDANVGSSADYMITQQIALLMKQFGFHSTQILVEGQILESLFGHVSTDEPITPEMENEIQSFE